METATRTGRAAFALAGMIFVIAQPEARTPREPCTRVAQLPGGDGHSVRVRCNAGADEPPLRGPARLLFGLPLDPNVAAADTLEVLPGIGVSRAAAIVREREQRPFESVDDLLRVHGIGPTTLARIAPFLAVEPDPEAGPRKTR